MNAFRTTVLVLGFAVFAACSSQTGGDGLNPYASGESDRSSGAFSPEAAQRGGGSASSADAPL